MYSKQDSKHGKIAYNAKPTTANDARLPMAGTASPRLLEILTTIDSSI
jgi:hypothetical protein